MKFASSVAAATVALAFAGAVASAEPPPMATPVERGIAVGTRAPMSNLKDQSGKVVPWKQRRAAAPFTAVIFYRSADW